LICSGFGGGLIFFLLAVGCGCHIEVAADGVVVEVDVGVAGKKVFMVVLGW